MHYSAHTDPFGFMGNDVLYIDNSTLMAMACALTVMLGMIAWHAWRQKAN